MAKTIKRSAEHLKPYQFKPKVFKAKNGFWSGVKDVGMGLAETTGAGQLSAVLTGNTLAENLNYEYNTPMGESFGNATSKIADTVGKAAPIVAGAYGGQAAAQGVQATQQASNQQIASNEANEAEEEQPSVPGATNNVYYRHGGETRGPVIEVEGKELEVQNGKVTQDFKQFPKHSNGGYRYSPEPNRVIIPSKMRDAYMEGNKTQKADIETSVIASQLERESGTVMKKGGLTNYLANKLRVPKYEGGGKTKYYGGSKDPLTGLRVDAPNPLNDRMLAEQWSKNNVRGVPKSDPYETYQAPGFDKTGEFSGNEWNQNPLYNAQFPYDESLNANLPANNFGEAYPSEYEKGKSNYRNFDQLGKDARTAGYYGAVAAPIAYNLYKGLQKPQVLEQKEFQNPEYNRIKDLYKGRNINMKPISDEIRDSYRIGLSNIGKGQKSSGNVLSGQTSLWASRMNALATANMNAQDKNNQYRGEEAQGLTGIGDTYARTKLGIQDINDRNRAARNAMLAKAAGQGSDLAQGLNRDDILYTLADQAYSDYGYNRPYGKDRGFKYRSKYSK